MYWLVLVSLLQVALTFAGPPPMPGIVIPLSKRMNLTLENGAVNFKALHNEIMKTTRKIQRGFDAYERNTGVTHPSSTRKLSQRTVGPVRLTKENDGALWGGDIQVGSPPRKFSVDFDTGSSDLFLPSSTCENTCDGHEKYDASSSSTAKNLGKNFHLAYGDGSEVMGTQYQDTVTIGGFTATGQTLGAASEYSDGFQKEMFEPDGLMGMGFKEISTFPANPVIQTLISQKKILKEQFSFKLADSGSELYIGGVNKHLYSGTFTEVPVTTIGYWEVDLDEIVVNKRIAVRKSSCIIDTGTTLIIGPTDAVKSFYDTIPGAKEFEDGRSGLFTVPCNSAPDVTLTFARKPFVIPASIFSLGPVSAGSSQCLGAIASMGDLELWIIGDIFLRTVYTTFDVRQESVGFAKLAN